MSPHPLPQAKTALCSSTQARDKGQEISFSPLNRWLGSPRSVRSTPNQKRGSSALELNGRPCVTFVCDGRAEPTWVQRELTPMSPSFEEGALTASPALQGQVELCGCFISSETCVTSDTCQLITSGLRAQLLWPRHRALARNDKVLSRVEHPAGLLYLRLSLLPK